MYINTDVACQNLIKEIEQLQAENTQLDKQIMEITKKDARTKARSRLKNEIAWLYWRIPVSWLDTVFFTKREELKGLATTCLLDEFIPNLNCNLCGCILNYEFHFAQVAALCEDVLETDSGIQLAMRDPYRRFKTTLLPLAREEANKLIGKILIIYCNSYNAGTNYSRLNTLAFEETDFYLRDQTKGAAQITDPVAKAAFDLKNIVHEDDAEKGITALQNYIRGTLHMYEVSRTSATSITIQNRHQNNATVYEVFFQNGEFWFNQKPSL